MGCPYCNSTNIGLNAGKIICNSCNRSWSPGGVEGQPIRVKKKYTKSVSKQKMNPNISRKNQRNNQTKPKTS